MKVVLRTDIDNLGKRGDIIDVADGYARNYLLPKGHAIRATAGVEAQAGAMRRSATCATPRIGKLPKLSPALLVPAVIRIPVRSGAGGRLFGSVTVADVADAVATQTGVTLDRRKIHLDEPIKSLGTHEVPVKLHSDVEFRVTVEVVVGS